MYHVLQDDNKLLVFSADNKWIEYNGDKSSLADTSDVDPRTVITSFLSLKNPSTISTVGEYTNRAIFYTGPEFRFILYVSFLTEEELDHEFFLRKKLPYTTLFLRGVPYVYCHWSDSFIPFSGKTAPQKTEGEASKVFAAYTKLGAEHGFINLKHDPDLPTAVVTQSFDSRTSVDPVLVKLTVNRLSLEYLEAKKPCNWFTRYEQIT